MNRLAVVVSSLVLLGACGTSEGPGGSKGSVGRTFAGLLRTVPDNAGTRTNAIFYANLDRLRDGEAPSSSDDDILLISERSSFAVFLPDPLRGGATRPGFAEYAGFDTRQVDAVLQYGAFPNLVGVFVGSMSAGKIGSGLAASPGGEELTKESADGVTYFSLGDDDTTDISAVSPIRPIGQPVRLALAGDTLFWARTQASADAGVAASAGTEPSLADDANYLAVANALDTATVINGIIVSPRAGEGWTVAGLGEAFAADSSTITVALQYASPALAAAAVAAFRDQVRNGASSVTQEPWSSVLTITEVSADGSLMMATLTSTNPGFAAVVLLREDNLLQF